MSVFYIKIFFVKCQLMNCLIELVCCDGIIIVVGNFSIEITKAQYKALKYERASERTAE